MYVNYDPHDIEHIEMQMHDKFTNICKVFSSEVFEKELTVQELYDSHPNLVVELWKQFLDREIKNIKDKIKRPFTFSIENVEEE
jgi:hypothetical protein